MDVWRIKLQKGCATLSCVCDARYRLSEEGEWLLKELDVEVERDEDGSVSLQDIRRITRLASQR